MVEKFIVLMQKEEENKTVKRKVYDEEEEKEKKTVEWKDLRSIEEDKLNRKKKCEREFTV